MKKTVQNIIIEVCETMCDEYCKHYDREKDKFHEDEDFDKFNKTYCDKCPLNKLY